MFWLLMAPPLPAQELPALYRVDVPDYPGALTSSDRGSLLSDRPEDVPWRHASLAELDEIGPVGPISAWEAIAAMGVGAWHDAGHDGSGVKVAVFDVQWYGAALDEAELGAYETHDCFTHRSCAQPIDTLRPTFSFETGSHGVACAEVIRDIAPGAELHLVRVSGLTTLESAVAWAIREEIDIISMSLSFFNESFYDGTGDVNELVPALAEAGVLMVTSAGNYADQHYRGDFTDADADRHHDFGGLGLPVYLPAGSSTLYLLWDQFQSCGRTDLDLFVTDADGAVVGWGADAQSPDADRCFPGERTSVQLDEPGWRYIQLRRSGGTGSTRFDIHTRRGEIFGFTAAGSITDPGTHPLAMTVGAVRATSYLQSPVEAFSSQGPTSSGLAKPDIAGPNGLSSSVYGPTGFYGTSASTPAVAGALALVMSREPGIDAYAAAERLRGWALRPAGSVAWSAHDPAEGAGRARLPDPTLLDGGCLGRGGTQAGLLAPLLLAGLRRRRRSGYTARQEEP